MTNKLNLVKQNFIRFSSTKPKWWNGRHERLKIFWAEIARVGSTPIFGTFNIGGLAQLIEHFACTEGVNGLNPLSSTIVMIRKRMTEQTLCMKWKLGQARTQTVQTLQPYMPEWRNKQCRLTNHIETCLIRSGAVTEKDCVKLINTSSGTLFTFGPIAHSVRANDS